MSSPPADDSDPDKKKTIGWTDEGAAAEFFKGIAQGTLETLTNPVRWLLSGFFSGGGDSK